MHSGHPYAAPPPGSTTDLAACTACGYGPGAPQHQAGIGQAAADAVALARLTAAAVDLLNALQEIDVMVHHFCPGIVRAMGGLAAALPERTP